MAVSSKRSARDACRCASDADCGQDNVICLDCQCIAQGDGPCLEVCAERRNRELGEGFCPVEYLDRQGCGGACGRLVAQGQAELQEVALACLLDDPLCFRSLNDCIFLQLYGEQAQARLRLSGRSFYIWEGATLSVSFLVEDAPFLVAATQIRDGFWEVAWEAQTWPGERVQAVIWIDADRDGACDASDLLRSVQLSRGESPLELTYEGVVEPNTLTQPELCAWF